MLPRAYLPLNVMGGRRCHCRKSFFLTLLSQPHLSHNFRPVVLAEGVVMNDCNDVVRAIPSQALPLCRRLFTAFFVDVSVQVREGPTPARAQLVRSGLGLLDDGECEVLGTWLSPPSGGMLGHEVLASLKTRGLEKVRFFVCSEPAQVRAEACIAYPGTTVLPSVAHLLFQRLALVAPRDRGAVTKALGAVGAAGSVEVARDAVRELAAGSLGASYPAVVERWDEALEQLGPLCALAPRLRRTLLSADGVVEQLHQSLTQAVARHGCFADRDAALSFIADALRRVERRLDARGTDRARDARTSVARPGTRSGTQALAI
jgi:transposase-like protein